MAATNPAFINQVLDLTNQFRAQNGLPALKLNTELNATAQGHSEDMANQDYFSHTGKNGSQPWDRAKVVGYEARATGENIAVGYTTPTEVVEGWKNSPGHRANLLNRNYTELGVGYFYLANDTGSVNYNSYWTQMFGSGDLNPATNLSASAPTPSPAPSPIPSPSPSPTPSNTGNDELIGSSTGEQLAGAAGNDRIYGNGGDDIISGGTGDDLLSGGAGDDSISGGEGKDVFLFGADTSFNASNFGIDRVTDFVRGVDKIALDKTAFGALSASSIGTVSRDSQVSRSSRKIVYSRGSGQLFYNQNGSSSGLGKGAAFAIIDSDNNPATAAPALSASSFQIVA